MTNSLKKALSKELLALANQYEVKQRKFLKNILFSEEYARWQGYAHNYTVHASQLRN